MLKKSTWDAGSSEAWLGFCAKTTSNLIAWQNQFWVLALHVNDVKRQSLEQEYLHCSHFYVLTTKVPFLSHMRMEWNHKCDIKEKYSRTTTTFSLFSAYGNSRSPCSFHLKPTRALSEKQWSHSPSGILTADRTSKMTRLVRVPLELQKGKGKGPAFTLGQISFYKLFVLYRK